MNREIAELATGVIKVGDIYRAILKPKKSRRTHLWLLQTDSKLDAVDFAENIAKKLGIEYIGEIKI